MTLTLSVFFVANKPELFEEPYVVSDTLLSCSLNELYYSNSTSLLLSHYCSRLGGLEEEEGAEAARQHNNDRRDDADEEEGMVV